MEQLDDPVNMSSLQNISEQKNPAIQSNEIENNRRILRLQYDCASELTKQ